MITLQEPPINDWKALTSQRVPLCHTHWWEQAPCGVVVDQGAWAEQAVGLLVARGCKRLAAASNLDRLHYPGRFWDGFDRGVRSAGLPPEAGETLVIVGDGSRTPIDQVAPKLAHELLTRRPRNRPDALVVSDDYVAAQLAFIFRETNDYRPAMAVQTNLRQPLLFALPAFRFEVDSNRLACRTVNLLLERVRNPTLPERIEWEVPRLAQSEPRPHVVNVNS